ERGPLGRPGYRVALACVRISGDALPVAAERLHVRRLAVEPRDADAEPQVVGDRRARVELDAGALDLADVVDDRDRAEAEDRLHAFVLVPEGIRRQLRAPEQGALVAELVGGDGLRAEIGRAVDRGIGHVAAIEKTGESRLDVEAAEAARLVAGRDAAEDQRV